MTMRRCTLGLLAACLMTSAPAFAMDEIAPSQNLDAARLKAVAPAPTTRAVPALPVSPGLARARINRFVGVETDVYERPSRDLSQGMQRDLERDQRPAAYGVAYMQISPKAQLFARIGYGGAKNNLAGRADDSWKYGAGAQFNRNARSGFRADYMRQGLPHTNVKANIFSFGLMKHF
jgi:hypothetical protein